MSKKKIQVIRIRCAALSGAVERLHTHPSEEQALIVSDRFHEFCQGVNALLNEWEDKIPPWKR